jgi:peptidoglycan hydrolase CwlO-like protein
VKNIGPRLACSFLVILLFVLTGAQVVQAEPQSLTNAKGQAATLEAQLKELKDQAAVLQDTYDSANAQLAQIEADAAEYADLLAQAQQDQVSAENALTERLIRIYKQGHGRTLDVLLSSSSLIELVDRLTLLQRIGEQDADLLQQVTDYRAQVGDKASKLTAQLERQETVAAEADAAQQAMTQKLAQAKQLLKGKEAEVAQLDKEWKDKQAEQARLEQARQARLEAALAAAQAAAQNGNGNGNGSGGGSGGNSGGSTTTTTHSTNTTTHGTSTTTTSGGGGGSYHAGVSNVLKPQQLALVAQKAGFSGENLVIAVAVALGESGGNANAIGRSKTYGLWQILASAHPSLINPSNPDASRWYDAYVNAKFAYKISGGKNWKPWSVYNSGSYQRYMDKARAGVELLLSDPGAVTPPTVK